MYTGIEDDLNLHDEQQKTKVMNDTFECAPSHYVKRRSGLQAICPRARTNPSFGRCLQRLYCATDHRLLLGAGRSDVHSLLQIRVRASSTRRQTVLEIPTLGRVVVNAFAGVHVDALVVVVSTILSAVHGRLVSVIAYVGRIVELVISRSFAYLSGVAVAARGVVVVLRRRGRGCHRSGVSIVACHVRR